ncbi:unnamed protein product [Cyprideis torosa]|uniref:Uncharacterized protein n=1 Tax=Cyprideis torosa TaxID=163714 RepID=A0A7R8ZKB5_9CRUS|nr:unnamed protein product [Cyprideis torosa]CAG0888958.1 unnamed protein product [Cyprideis torosa]
MVGRKGNQRKKSKEEAMNKRKWKSEKWKLTKNLIQREVADPQEEVVGVEGLLLRSRAEGRPNGAEGRPKRAEGRPKRAEGRPKGAEGVLKEAEGVLKEAEGVLKGVEGRLKGVKEMLKRVKMVPLKLPTQAVIIESLAAETTENSIMALARTKIPATSVKDVPQDEFVVELAAFLKKSGKLKIIESLAAETTENSIMALARTKIPATSVKDVPQDEFVVELAAFLKKSGKLKKPEVPFPPSNSRRSFPVFVSKVPEWADLVKTGKQKELGPYNPDWFYVRCASIARRCYIRSPVGVGAVRKIYGGNKRNGVSPSHFVVSSGCVARKALQALTEVNIIESHPEGGRRLSHYGRRVLDRIAANIAKGGAAESVTA